MNASATLITRKFSNFAHRLVYLPKTFRLIGTLDRGWTVVWACLLFIDSLLPVGTVYLSRVTINSLLSSIGHGTDWAYLRPTLLWILLMALAYVLTQIVQSALTWVRAAQAENLSDSLSHMIHQKAASVDMEFYESPEYYDRLHQALGDLKTRPLALLESTGSFVQSSITLLAMGALLLPYGAWIPLVLMVSTLPALYTAIYHNRLHHTWWQRTTTDRRWVQYYDTMLTADTVAAELRLFSLGTPFQHAYQEIRGRLRKEYLDLLKQRSFAQLISGGTAGLATAAVMAWMVWRAILGAITLGDIALFYQAFTKGQALARNSLNNVGNIYDNTLFLENLFEFLSLQPRIVSPIKPVVLNQPLQHSIHFRDLSFGYPGSQNLVFRNFDLTIPAGKIVAIVGANGAGKTTLVKLLCRFYDPISGAVELDGVDIRELSVDELRRLITGMFQFPVPYMSTVAENIAMGDRSANPQLAQIRSAAHSAGAHDFITRLPCEYDTLLGKLFPTGVQLSGGEWQRLALARAFLRQAPIMILDEPTSFLDSWSEIDWYERLRRLAADRTTILITHRFSTARRADIIHVMDCSQIVESGTHDELLALDGHYRDHGAHKWLRTHRSLIYRIAPN